MPSEYRGKRFGGIEEVSHHSDRTYAKTVASRIEGFVGQEMALKICAWKNTEREVMIVPTNPSRVVSGVEMGSSGASQFHYLDKVQNVTSVSIPLKAGETLRADHPDLARHIAEHPGALHMCRLHTDFAAPGKPSRIEVVSVE